MEWLLSNWNFQFVCIFSRPVWDSHLVKLCISSKKFVLHTFEMCVCDSHLRKKNKIRNSSTFRSPGCVYWPIVKLRNVLAKHYRISFHQFKKRLHRKTNKWINFRKLFKILWVFCLLCVSVSLFQCVWVCAFLYVCVWKLIFVSSVERSVSANTHLTKSNPILDAWLWFCFVANFESIYRHRVNTQDQLLLFVEEVWFSVKLIHIFNIAPNDDTQRHTLASNTTFSSVWSLLCVFSE